MVTDNSVPGTSGLPGVAQIAADGQIAAGQDPALYADALKFANRAVAVAGRQGMSSDDVFVDGH